VRVDREEQDMHKWKSILGPLLLVIALGAAWPVLSAMRAGELGLAPALATCDGKSTYKYVATWTNSVKSPNFQVNTGNKCKLGGNICGVSNKVCYATCTPQGKCTAQMNGCQIGKGSPWIQVTATNGTLYQRKTAAAPSKCN
jgi:hypothetical protein